VVAAAVLVGLVALAAQQERWAGPVFAALLALTVPHLVVVAVLDLATLRPADRSRVSAA